MSSFENHDIADIILNIYSKPIFTEEGIAFNISSLYPKILAIIKEKKLLLNESKNIDHFETKNFCSLILNGIAENINTLNFHFNSNYSLLYYIRIIEYFKIINKKKDILEDNQIKIFLYAIYLLITNTNEECDFDELNEAFFKGTFYEIKKKYYQNENKEENIDGIIDKIKKNWTKAIINEMVSLFNFQFERILMILMLYGKDNDKIIVGIKEKISAILYIISNLNDDYLNNNLQKLKEKIRIFYKDKDVLLFLFYYISKKEEEQFKQNSINSEILNNNDNLKFIQNNLKREKNDIIEVIREQLINSNDSLMFIEKIVEYFDQKDDNEIILCSLKDYADKKRDIEKTIKEINKNIENLEQHTIKSYIENILDSNDFYEIFFSIMKSDTIKAFYSGNVSIFDKDNESEYKLIENKDENSECFKEMYEKFINIYDNKNDNYKKFKNLFVIKILSKCYRACLYIRLKKIIINPSQFFYPEDLKNSEDEFIEILKSYLIIVLLLETEHFLRLLSKKGLYIETPRGKGGGKLFIKYLFGIEIINRINSNQAKIIMSIKDWKNPETIQALFVEQKDTSTVVNMKENIYPKTISYYYSNRSNRKTNKNNKFVKY